MTKISFFAADTKTAQSALNDLKQHHDDVDVSQADVLVTLGGDGAMLSVNGQTHTIPAAAATPVDSTGAGDSFGGSFLARWLETSDPVSATRYAAQVAAGTVSGLGAVDPIPRRADVLSRLAS
jgi:2-dehydro-3-deoxygluconokinase